jgi:hypothetical protein
MKIILVALFLAIGLSGCISSPKLLDGSQACDASYVGMQNDPDKFLVGYQKYSLCAQRVEAENDRREGAWDNAVTAAESMPRFEPAPNPYAAALSELPKPPPPMPIYGLGSIQPLPPTNQPVQHCIGQIPVNANVAMLCP